MKKSKNLRSTKIIIMTILKNDDTMVSYKLRSLEVYYLDLNDMVLDQAERGIIQRYDLPAPIDIPWWVSFLPYIVMIVLFIVLWVFVMNQASGRGGKFNNFGKARAKIGSDEKRKKGLLPRCCGCGRGKAELVEIVDFSERSVTFQQAWS